MSNKTRCPECGADIDVNDILYHQLESEFDEKLKDATSKLSSKEKALADQQAQIDKTIDEQVAASLLEAKKKLQNELQDKLELEQAGRIEAMELELNEKSKQLAELNKTKSEIERLKREKQEQKAKIELQTERKFNQQLVDKTAEIKKNMDSQSAMKIAEKEQLIQQLTTQLSDAQRKAEQGSVQLQGEVQELAIERWLAEQYPLDTIEEIKKGAQGADTLQIINTHERPNCGSIYYESKRTKAFQPNWIAKFKHDIQQKGANIGVLVTEVMPETMKTLGQIDGVWVCTFDEFKNLSQVLRESIIQVNQAVATQENKGDKMEMLYDFLTGNEFRMQIEAIVEGFTQLKSDLESEKRSMQSIWKKREKQIERVLLNTNYMYSSVKGIAGNAVQNIPLLELEDEQEES